MKGVEDEDLIQRVLDGQASAEDERTLRERLAREPALRARYEDLERVFAALRDVQSVEPPADLVPAILSGLRASRTAEPSGWRATIAALRARFTPSLAYAFAAGIVAGIAVFGTFSGRLRTSLDSASPGALLPSDRLAAADVLDTSRLDVGGWRGTVTTRTLNGFGVAEIECESGAGAVIRVDYDPRGLAVLGFERASHSTGEVAVTPGRVQLAPQGKEHYRIWFEVAGSGPTVLAIGIDSGGTTLQRVVRAARAAR